MRIGSVAMCALTGLLAVAEPLSAQVQGQWTAVGAMQTPRELNAQAPISGGNVLAIGGVDNSGNILASAEIYDAAKGVWALTGSMQAAREDFPAVVLTNGKILVSGGLGTGDTVLGAAELFDPKTHAWTPAGSLSTERFGHTATLLANGKVLVAGGCTVSGCSASMAASEIYDPTTNSWTATGGLNTARAHHTAVRLGAGTVLAIGGFAGGASASTELYDPVTGAWSYAASTNTPRYRNGTSLLPDGKVLVTGGVITKYPLNSAEVYDPASNAWSPTGSMTAGRYAHSSTLLSDGSVLLAGGQSQAISCGKACVGFIPTWSAETYDEATGTFTARAPLPRALAYQTATEMKNGRALASGGLGYNAYCCQVVSNAEFYTPLTLSFSPVGLNLGFLQLGLTSALQTVTVTNSSPHASAFASIASSGDFAQSNNCPSTLAPGQTCAINVSFTPTAAGSRNGAVTLTDDDPGSPRQSIALTGVGEMLALGFSPVRLNLGSVPVTLTSTQSATLINDGAAPVNLTAITISPANHTFTQTNNCPATLNVQQSCTLQLVFAPPDVFTYKAILSIANGAGAPATLKLVGAGLDGP